MNQHTAYKGPGKRIRTNPELFLSKTEGACRHFFGGLDLYEQKVDEASEDVLSLDPLSREFKDRMQALKTFLASDFARALLAGSILQIAYMGIEMFSRNESIPRQCDWIVKHDNKTNKKAVAFSVGRPVPDQQIVECYSFGPRAQQIPLGLVVYAGRNQYCHWYDIERRFERSRQKPRNASVAAVFSALATDYHNHPDLDLAFGLGHPWIPPVYAYTIIRSVLQWHGYESYCQDMVPLLKELAECRTGESGTTSG